MKVCTKNVTKIIIKSHITQCINILIRLFAYNTLINCDEHNLQLLFMEKFSKIFIFTDIKHVNLILKGNYSFNINDDIFKLALVKYKKIKQRIGR